MLTVRNLDVMRFRYKQANHMFHALCELKLNDETKLFIFLYKKYVGDIIELSVFDPNLVLCFICL